jgi:hypothetical protein
MVTKNNSYLLRVVIQLVIVVVIAPLLPMIISGDWG